MHGTHASDCIEKCCEPFALDLRELARLWDVGAVETHARQISESQAKAPTDRAAVDAILFEVAGTHREEAEKAELGTQRVDRLVEQPRAGARRTLDHDVPISAQLEQR